MASGEPGAGTESPPSSVTAIRATPSRGQSTSTMNTPPFPEAVCAIAFVPSSDTQDMSVSLAGQPTSISPTNRRASGTDAGVPQNVRVDGRVDRAGPADPSGSTG